MVIRPAQEALDEVEREVNVRLKCFDRWVDEGRLSYTDAKDRLERLMAAFNLISEALDREYEQVPAGGPIPAGL